MIALGRVLHRLPVQEDRELDLPLHRAFRIDSIQKQVEGLVGHQSVGEDSQERKRLQGFQGGRKNVREPRVQSGFAAHEIYQGSAFDPRQKLHHEIIVIHGFAGGLDGLFHVLIGKAVITF